MKAISLGLLACFLASTSVGGEEAKMNPAKFLARIEWSQNDTSPHGITANDCVLVLPDGHFHMEHRLQQLPVPRASLEIFESVLSNNQIMQLREILDRQEIQELPTFVSSGIPGSVYLRLSFQAEISRDPKVQNVGYMDWKVNVGADSDEHPREALKQAQSKAETALQPLLQWFLNLESQKLPPSNSESTFCEV